VLNRRGLFEVIAARGGPGSGHFGILFCDVDDFKAVHDEHGHAVGDQVLVEVASRLIGLTRSDDLVARFGGDEFVVFCPEADEGALTTLAQRIEERMRAPLQTSNQPLTIKVSVGGATGRAGDDLDDLLARADQNMYGVKIHRRSRR
jgi:cyclic di-GMP phosphodiesterase Gmr